MDDASMLKTAGMSTTGLALLLITYRILKIMQGKKLITNCCGRKMELGIDIDNSLSRDDDTIVNVKPLSHKVKKKTNINSKINKQNEKWWRRETI
jgi:hypothetical protein